MRVYDDNVLIDIGPRLCRPLARLGEIIRLWSKRPLKRGPLDSLFLAHYNGMPTGGGWAPRCGIELRLRTTTRRGMPSIALPDSRSSAEDSPPMTGRIKPIVLIGISGAFTLWAFWFVYRTSFVAIDGRRYFSLFDDAMVSMRYAWNLAHGNGLVWNIGEHVEGYTNLLQTLVMSVFALILDKTTAVLAVQILGVAVMIVNAWLAVLVSRYIQLGRFDTRRTTFELMTFIGVLGYYPLVYWSVMGMETGLLTGLLLLATLFMFRLSINGDRWDLMMSSVGLGLAFLARPDSVIVAAVILGYGLLEVARRLPRRRALAIGGLAILIYLLLPCTAVLHGSSNEKRLLLVVGGALIAYQILIGGDAWRLWRMVSPGIPLLLVLFNGELVYLSGVAGDVLRSRTENRLSSGGSGAPPPGDPRSEAAGRDRLLLASAGIAGMGLAGLGLVMGVVNPVSLSLAVESRAGLIWGALLGAALAILALRTAMRQTTPSFTASGLGLAFFVALGSLNARFLPEMLDVIPPYQVGENASNANTAIAVLSATTDEA